MARDVVEVLRTSIKECDESTHNWTLLNYVDARAILALLEVGEHYAGGSMPIRSFPEAWREAKEASRG